MSNGANSVHKQLRSELENYIKSQYFGKSPILLSAINSHLDDESLLYQRPYIESSPAYKSYPEGIKKTDLPDWLKQFMGQLSAAELGVYSAPFVHQIDALKAAFAGKDLFVSTGTGSGKTECFMWPLLAKLADEAKNSSGTWETRGIRTVIMYPMNALVSDQVSRLRRLIGDKDNKFVSIFRDICGADVRRPQFGMYTGRTPYPGTQPKASENKQLVQTLSRMAFPKNDSDKEYLKRLNSEYAPGRAIVVDKKTYQLGGLFVPGSKNTLSPAKAFLDDPNYLKGVQLCQKCGWFGLEDEKVKACPFCDNKDITLTTQMLKPWGFAPKNAEKIHDAQLDEEYSYTQPPLYSTLPDSDDIKEIPGYKNIRIASRTNQRIIMLNSGPSGAGFMVCEDCGAAMPGDSKKVLDELKRPYKSYRNLPKCKHPNAKHVNLGYDFVTDMMVLEIALDASIINIELDNRIWLNRAAQSLAEALRLAASQELDIEFTELISGYRFRNNSQGAFFDIYLYDSLSSGAG